MRLTRLKKSGLYTRSFSRNYIRADETRIVATSSFTLDLLNLPYATTYRTWSNRYEQRGMALVPRQIEERQCYSTCL